MVNEVSELTAIEQHVVDRAADLATTRRRIRLSLLSAALMAAAVVAAGWASKSWQFLVVVFVIYIAATSWERIRYGRAVLLYKTVVRKLHQRRAQTT